MKRPTSLRTRLVVGVMLAQLVLAGGLVWAGTLFARRQLRRAFDAGLEGRLMSIAALVRYPESGGGLIFDASLVPPPRHQHHPPFYQVRDNRGRVIASTFPAGLALPAADARDAEDHWHFQAQDAPYRGLVVRRQPVLDTEEGLTGPPPALTIYYAAPAFDIADDTAAAGLAIGLTSLALLGVTWLLAAWAVRRGLEPLHELAAQAAAITPRNWRFHASPAAAARELEPLIQALERMLERLHASYEQQREFMADAAHHLKTPVAILKSTLQALQQRPRPIAEYATAVQASLADVERLEGLLQRMLRLARMEQTGDDGRPRDLPWTDVGATCQAALERVQPLAQARGVALRASGMSEGWKVSADADDLELIWVNLLENAVEHSPSGAGVEITCSRAEAGLRVTVRDQGQGIAPTEVPFIFERFRRGENARPGGFGLGLAIARAIVTAYGGAIAVEPQAAPGATLAVQLPLATA